MTEPTDGHPIAPMTEAEWLEARRTAEMDLQEAKQRVRANESDLTEINRQLAKFDPPPPPPEHVKLVLIPGSAAEDRENVAAVRTMAAPDRWLITGMDLTDHDTGGYDNRDERARIEAVTFSWEELLIEVTASGKPTPEVVWMSPVILQELQQAQLKKELRARRQAQFGLTQ